MVAADEEGYFRCQIFIQDCVEILDWAVRDKIYFMMEGSGVRTKRGISTDLS